MKKTVILIFFVKWKAQDNLILANFIKTAPKNASYLSPQIQNELIDCLGRVIRREIINEVSKSDFFSIMADETCDSFTVEQLAICIRYLRLNHENTLEVAEDFLGFVTLNEMNAAAITNALLTNLQSWQLDLSKWRGKGFDGASTMSGHVSGVATRITQSLPKAKYFTHCRNHCLNLVIVNSCAEVPEVRNFMDSFRELSFFVSNSSKRKSILVSRISQKDSDDLLSNLAVHEEELIFQSNRRQGLPTLCETRWLSRVDSISTLLVKYDQVIDALKDISTASMGQSRSDADQYLKKMSSFSFILTAVMTQYILGFVRPISVALQSRECAYMECQDLIKTMKNERSDSKFHKLFTRAADLLKMSFGDDVEPEVPRAASNRRHAHRPNAPAETTEGYYLVNYYYPFLDHVISHLTSRFPEELKGALLGYYFMPDKVAKLTDEIQEAIKKEFYDDLPMPHCYEQEVIRWKQKFSKQLKPDARLIDVVNLADKSYYPNISKVLCLLLSLPVGSCSCERSFSALRRLKTWCRASMKEDRLNGLVLSNIHKDHPTIAVMDPLEVLKLWDSSMHRRIALAFDV